MMPSQHSVPTYDGNQLIEACGPIIDPAEVARRLVHLPPRPSSNTEIPRHLLPHLLADVWRLHIPAAAGIEIFQTIDMMLRQGYVHRHPSSPATWRRIYSLADSGGGRSPIQLASLVSGLSGTGKSTAIERALGLFRQVVLHESLPGLVGPVQQLVWLKTDVPASGKIRDLVESLALATDAALGTRFADDLLRGSRASGSSLAHRWLQRISCHFPGIIVFDEVQNLFKIQLKSVREQAARARSGERPSLRIIDDEALKLLLTITNVSKIPTLWCATPDGMAALNTRMSTSQRLITAGFHQIPHPTSADDDFFRKRFLPTLSRYQWLPQRMLTSDEDLRKLIFELSAGIPRICIALWVHAHRCALRRTAVRLELEDFRFAATHDLAPVMSAVQALHSGDPKRLSQYEDAMSQAPHALWR